MTSKTIYLTHARNRTGYLVRCFQDDCSIPIEFSQVDATFTDNHYLLTENGRKEPRSFWNNSLGVAHTPKQADKRLYKRALEIVKEMSKRHKPVTIENKVTEKSSFVGC